MAPCSMTPDAQSREPLQDAVEDHGGERLGRRPGNPHVVDGPEVLLTAVEVGRHGQAVHEVVAVDEIAGAADVEDEGQAGFLDTGPDGIEGPVTRRVSGGTP